MLIQGVGGMFTATHRNEVDKPLFLFLVCLPI